MNEWLETDTFDPAKFKARYGLTNADFEVAELNGLKYVRLRDGVVIADKPPLFEPPDPLPPLKTLRAYAIDLIEELAPNATPQKKARMLDILRRLIGELPPERG